MGYILTIHSKKSKQENFWFDSSKYDMNVINDIKDPTGNDISKLLTAIPTPFARMHLFETAFYHAYKNIKNEKFSVFDKMVSDCFDLFELLFDYETHKNANANLSILIWDYITHTQNLSSSNLPEHKNLSEVLQNYYISNDRLKDFNPFYLFLLDGEVFGGTSPFTGCFTKPDLNNFPLLKNNGKPYFSEISPLWLRDEEFLIYLFYLFSPKHPLLISSAKSVFNYISKAVEFVPNSPLKSKLKNILNINTNVLIKNFNFLKDNNNSILKICDAEIHCKSIDDFDIVSPLLIKSSLTLPDYCNNKIPLVLTDNKDYLNNTNLNIKVPTNCGDIQNITSRSVPGLNRVYPFLVVDDFFEDVLVQLNYPINSDYFLTLNLNNDDDIGFLLPIKKHFLDFFTIDDLKNFIKIEKVTDGFKVSLDIPVTNGEFVQFKKFYYKDPKLNNYGKLITANFYLAFFPLFRVKDSDEFNNFYKIMLVDNDDNFQNIVLNFYNDYNELVSDNPNAPQFFKNVIRNHKSSDIYGGSSYYESNFCYKFLEVVLNKNNSSFKGLIIPRWKEINLGNISYNIAVDFGTTNTYMVLLENNQNNKKPPQTFSIGEADLQTVLFNKVRKNNNHSLTEIYESRDDNFIETRLISRVRSEFVPSIIGEGINPFYKFPLRTAVSTSKNYTTGSSQLLSNINISFKYGKDIRRSDEDIDTNLKWSIDQPDVEQKIKEFIRELLLLARNKILLNRGNPKHSTLIWFKPLSMRAGHQNFFGRIWYDAFNEIFNPDKQFNQPICISESCAPFYYYAAQYKAQSTKPVLSIDIGGGSTDVSFFLNNNPQFGISFPFAGDAIWNPGLKRRHEYVEGIFLKYGSEFISETIKNSDENRKELVKKIFDIHNSNYGNGLHSETVFNLYFDWDNILHFTDALKRDGFIRFLILFHFSSIIYFSVQLLKIKRLNKPEYICLSGNGSKYLSIIDSSPDLNLINGFINNFVSDIFDNKFDYSTKIQKVDKEKEATSLGGLFLLEERRITGNIKDTDEPQYFYGEVNPQLKQITYNDINDNLKLSVDRNVKSFIDLFFHQNSKYDFSNNLLITLNKPLSYYHDFCKQNSLKNLEVYLMNKKNTIDGSEKLNEPLFFYPIISLIYELSLEFYGK